MEKREKIASSVLFITNGITLIICMFMNWLPGVFRDALGKINALTLSTHIKDLADLEAFPKESATAIVVSTLMMICAIGTIVLYICGIVVHILRVAGKFRKEETVELFNLTAAVCAILTCIMFYAIISNKSFNDVLDCTAFSFLKRTPWLNALLAAIFCLTFTRKIVAAYIVVIVENFDFLVSDVIGAFAGIYAGKMIASLAGSTVLGVIAGLGVACLVAVVCCFVACKLFGKKFSGD